jgi:hypothetical protein
MKLLLAGSLILVTIDCLRAGIVTDVQVVEFGSFRKTNRGLYTAPRSIRGMANSVNGATLIERTTEIHASKGTSFGLRVRVTGQPDSTAARFTCRCIHPKFTDPASGRSSTVEEWESQAIIGGIAYVGYAFDNSWELVPGKWTIQIFYGATRVARKEFDVIPAAAASNQSVELTAIRCTLRL